VLELLLRNKLPGESIMDKIFEHQFEYSTITVISICNSDSTVDKSNKILEFVQIRNGIITIGVNSRIIDSSAMSHAFGLLSRIDDIAYNQYVEFKLDKTIKQ